MKFSNPVDTQITLNTKSRVGGLIRIERKKKKWNLNSFLEISIFRGRQIRYPDTVVS
jgi:hypothetical protein